ncbi:transaldolase family protein [Holdemanella sp.]|uniref:transaldolase family protein n=2 Tax=Holdemanella TaxID=1573535 RepID=UPI00258EAF25|nr:transaldolase family protein [Holdemanella sp.]
MELIIDSSNIEQIKELNELLTITGVTTNPTILTKSNREAMDVVKDLCEVLSEEQLLFIQTVQTSFEGIMEEAKMISSIRNKNISIRNKNMYVKIPVTHEGLRAIKECKKLGIHTLATAIYTADQAFLAAMNGAEYLAPYTNRMCNYGDGVQNVKDLIEMLRVNHMPAKVIAASFKNTYQVHELIKAGIQAVTVPCDVLYQMIDHPGTKIAVGEFSVNWQRAYNRNTLEK